MTIRKAVTTDSSDNGTLRLDKKGQDTLLALLTYKTKTLAAKALSIERSTLYQRIETYNLAKFIDELPARALETLKLGSERAAEVLVEALEDRGNKMEASKEILDRVGLVSHKPGISIVNEIDLKDMNIEFIDPSGEKF